MAFGQVVNAVIFDFDGVLVDSEAIRFRAGADALREIGVSLTWERFLAHWFGRPDAAGLRDLLGERYEAEAESVFARRNALYKGQLDEVEAFPDALRLMRRLPSTVRLGLATGSRRTEVERILKRLGLLERFQAIVTAGDYAQAKPAPDPFLAAASLLGVPPPVCLVIEDSPAGVASALGAGMRVVGVNRRPGAGLERATWQVDSLDDFDVWHRVAG